jgi:hypothetical protein
MTALPDGIFLRQICKILAGLNVVWRAKKNSGGLPSSGGFDQFCMGLFLSGGFGAFIRKKQLASHFFCIKKLVDLKK